MAERIDFKVVTNVATNGRKAEIIGHAEDGPASVLLPAETLPAVMASLSAIEEELNAGTSHYSMATFHYQGFETRTTGNQGEAMLIISCHPDVRFAFLLSSAQMSELGKGCTEAARLMLLTPGRKPS